MVNIFQNNLQQMNDNIQVILSDSNVVVYTDCSSSVNDNSYLIVLSTGNQLISI